MGFVIWCGMGVWMYVRTKIGLCVDFCIERPPPAVSFDPQSEKLPHDTQGSV